MRSRKQALLSELLLSFRPQDTNSLSLSEIADRIADRSLGGLLAFFSGLNLIPLPPGTSTITGIPIVLIAIQLIFLKKKMWMPEFLRSKKMDAVKLDNLLVRLAGWITRLELYLKPRYWPFSVIAGERMVGLLCLVMGLMVVFPIPFGNFTPAFSAMVLGMALSEKDGIWLTLGLFCAVLSTLWVMVLVSGALYAASLL